MSKLIIFCVEADKKSQSDYVYIKTVIDKYYIDDKKTVIRPVFLGSKSKYNDKSVAKEINTLRKGFNNSEVIYFIDEDDASISSEVDQLNTKIEEYCKNNGYELVVFCRDIEEVFWGERIHDSEKVKKAEEFRRKKIIDSIDERKLSVTIKKKKCSNILRVLNEYLKRRPR